MADVKISKEVKSTTWLDTGLFSVHGTVLKKPLFEHFRSKPVKIGFLEDDFELDLVRMTKEVLKVSVLRKEANKAVPDRGYFLKFHFTMVDSDEETQINFMKYGENEIDFTFKLSESTLENISSMNKLEFIVVVEILELESLEEEEKCGKKLIKNLTDFLRQTLKNEVAGYILRILNHPILTYAFKGRKPEGHLKNELKIILLMLIEYSKIIKYLEARYNNQEPDTDLDLGRLLHLLAQKDGKTPIPNEKAVQQYLLAHRLGLDCYKILTSDYLAKILHEDLVVLDILEAALFVQDIVMFDKAAICLVEKYHEVISSEEFRHLIKTRGCVARLIIHAIRVRLPRRDTPKWARPAAAA